MSKALVIYKEDLQDLEPNITDKGYFTFNNRGGLRDLPTLLLHRDLVETNENYIQLIPYVALVNSDTKEIFTYRRGSKSGENRLLNKCSIGVGGHVEEKPYDAISLTGVLALSALRELNEEVGLPITYAHLESLDSDVTYSNYDLIYHKKDDVGKVHLGIGLILFVDSNDISELETDVINDSAWLSIDELKRQHDDGIRVLEEWSLQWLLTELEDCINVDY